MEIVGILNQVVPNFDLKENLFEPLPEGEGHSLTEDLWSFGPYWLQVQTTYKTVENLYHAIQDLRDKIDQITEYYRPQIAPLNGQLDPISIGISGSYYLLNEEGQPVYVVKPMDEDAGCLSNPKKFRTPFEMSPIRLHMPLYGAPFREVASYDIACLIGISQVIPKTTLTLIHSETFYDFSESIAPEMQAEYLKQVGEPNKEKLCSAQEFVPNSKTLFTALHELQAMDLSDNEIAVRFDQTDFEEANILLWTTYDTDGHSGNFLCYPKGTDSVGNELLGLKKIDNGLTFPQQNKQLRNHLANLPNAKLPLSSAARVKINAIDIEAIAKKLETYHLDSTVLAFRERMAILKNLDPESTIQQINRKMRQI